MIFLVIYISASSNFISSAVSPVICVSCSLSHRFHRFLHRYNRKKGLYATLNLF